MELDVYCYRLSYIVNLESIIWPQWRIILVPEAGIEPARPKASDFKSLMSTDFITRALLQT